MQGKIEYQVPDGTGRAGQIEKQSIRFNSTAVLVSCRALIRYPPSLINHRKGSIVTHQPPNSLHFPSSPPHLTTTVNYQINTHKNHVHQRCPCQLHRRHSR